MTVLAIFFWCVLGGYLLLLIWILYEWGRSAKDPISKKVSSPPFISIVIAARNEEESIEACITSIIANDFPSEKYEIILVDDHSTDATVEKAKALNASPLTILHHADYLQGKDIKAFKKSALNYAIQVAKGEIILCTDADCIMGRHWISSMVEKFIDPSTHLVTGMVEISGTNLLENFQKIDCMGMMATTNAGIQTSNFILANGANMAFRRASFMTVGGHGVEGLATGDDVFLAEKMSSNFGNCVKFIRNNAAKVFTKAEKTLSNLMQQRLRWASKNGSYDKANLTALSGFVFLVNLMWISILFYFIAFIQNIDWALIAWLLIKVAIDLLYIWTLKRCMKIPINPFYILICVLIYPFYIVLIGFMTLLKVNYDWKGRALNPMN